MVPADVLLLIAVALVVTVSWIGKEAPSWLLLVLSILSYPLIFVGIAIVTLSLVDAYMVGIDRVPPGEPMFLDELAYPFRDALLDLMRGVDFSFWLSSLVTMPGARGWSSTVSRSSSAYLSEVDILTLHYD